MNVEIEAARCVVVGIRGTTPTPEELELVRRGVGGVILFSRNVRDPEQVAGLSRALKAAAPGPLLVAIDQEGGRVQRLRAPAWTEWPPMRRLGERDARAGDGEALAGRLGRALAAELSACGIDWDFAPVVDVDSNPQNPVIGDRAFARDAARVARLGVALARGLEEGGVASCAKHFPGHGDTATDSHKTLPRLGHALARLRQVELLPFAAAARAGLASVMTAHVVFEQLDGLPATLSARALRLLRDEVGFKNVCVSDDLEMKAIAERWFVPEAAELALAAGCDCVLVCHTLALQHATIDALARAVRSGPIPEVRLAEASARMARLARFARPASAIDPGRARLGLDPHRALAAELGGPQGALHDPTEASARA